ncbi:hypothetical protein [uncultured Alsobacter sp.]|uniref:hypothetical protein n=1 Tax=uncultured Alsobacter sp. TaxID=1748258 RepID=UPI0025E06F66|nr:hypothetical protein [uncultured Alsobacter sp.]
MIRVSKLGRAAAALVVGASLVATTLPAEAGWRHGYGGYGGYGGYPAYGGGYGYRQSAYPAYGYGYKRHRNNNAGLAIAAGVIGALALGAIASQSHAAPAYGYGAPCRVETRKVYDAWGYPHWQQVQACY